MQPWFDEKEKHALIKYLENGGWLTEFNETKEFSKMIAEYTGAKYCSILCNGTVTMTAALIAFGITNKEDEVIVPAYTMIATPNAVIMAGSTPVFCDVESETMCMDFESLQKTITDRTKAIILVSINGRYPKFLEQILSLCKEKNIHVIEDAAQSLGSFYKGKHVGRYGCFGSFSFSMPKIITTGQGGALITDNEELFNKIELIKNFGREQAGIDKHILYGVNFKFTDLQAVIGIEQMKKLSERTILKKINYQLYRELLSNIPSIKFLETSTEVTPWFNDILVKNPENLQSFLKSCNIGSRPFYPTVTSQEPYKQNNLTFPNAEYISSHGLWLPSYSQLKHEEIQIISDAIHKYYS